MSKLFALVLLLGFSTHALPADHAAAKSLRLNLWYSGIDLEKKPEQVSDEDHSQKVSPELLELAQKFIESESK